MTNATKNNKVIIVSIGKYNINKNNLPYQCCKDMITGEIYYIGNKFVPLTLGEKIYKYNSVLQEWELDFVVKSIKNDPDDSTLVFFNDDPSLLHDVIDMMDTLTNKRLLQENTIMVGRVVYNGAVCMFIPDMELEFVNNPLNPIWNFYLINNKGRISYTLPDYRKFQIPSVTFGGECMSNLLDFINKTHYNNDEK